MITEPCALDGYDEAKYHADPIADGSLSATEAKTIILSSPAQYRYDRDQGEKHRDYFDVGHAVHALVLGVGAEIRHIDSDSWRDKDARQERDEAYADGLIPLKNDDWHLARAMYDAVMNHPIAGAIFRQAGRPELSLFWHPHSSDDLWCRGRVDWLLDRGKGSTFNVDLKTVNDIGQKAWERSIADHGYHIQAAHYEDGIRTLGIAKTVSTIWVAVSKRPPHFVAVHQLDSDGLQIGRDLRDRAIDIWAKCRDENRWPGPADEEIITDQLPIYAQREADHILGLDDEIEI